MTGRCCIEVDNFQATSVHQDIARCYVSMNDSFQMDVNETLEEVVPVKELPCQDAAGDIWKMRPRTFVFHQDFQMKTVGRRNTP